MFNMFVAFIQHKWNLERSEVKAGIWTFWIVVFIVSMVFGMIYVPHIAGPIMLSFFIGVLGCIIIFLIFMGIKDFLS